MKKVFYILIIIISASSINFGQQISNARLDSLYDKYVKARTNLIEGSNYNPTIKDSFAVKCSFELVSELKINFERFSSEKQIILKQLFNRPSYDASIVTPNGFFKIHYFTSGPNAPGYNLSDLANALDSVYSFEVNYLGYPAPPGDSTAGVPDSTYGGDNRYDIYITNLDPYVDGYGYTQPENAANNGPNTYTSYMVIDNDFGQGYYTHGINAAKVTVAHEFHHSIQIGNYIYRDNDRFFYELTSTSMEEFVFSSINDYYNYMQEYFLHPEKCFSNNSGYDLAIWNIYLKNNYGFDVIKNQWQLMPQMRAMNAINSSLNAFGSNFKFDLNRFGLWTYYTNYRTIPGQFFSEADNYPLIRMLNTLDLTTNSMTLDGNAFPMSNNFIKFINTNLNPPDTLNVLITHSDIQNSLDNQTVQSTFNYGLYTYSMPAFTKITDGYYERLITNNSEDWSVANILNNRIVKQDSIPTSDEIADVNYAYPNPYNYADASIGGSMFFPVKLANFEKADLNIYSISMNLVYKSEVIVIPPNGNNGDNVVKWNVKDNNNNKLPTGIYIYVIRSGDKTFKGKLVIFNG